MTSNPDDAYELYRAGREALEAGDAARAITSFERALAADPHFKTMELLGVALMKVGRVREAVVFLAAAVGLGNKQSRARFLLAEALVSLGRPDEAITKLEEALALNHNYTAARQLLERLRTDVTTAGE